MVQKKVKILYQKKLKGNYFCCGLAAPVIASQAKPGQFLNIRINVGGEPLLRRPLSIHRIKGSHIEILYEVLGQGTEALSWKKPGGYLDVIGPLGNGFKLDRQIGKQAIIVSGGMGVAPLTFLAEKLVHSSLLKTHGKPLVLLGAKTKKQILCEKEFRDLTCQVKVATDDGSKGFKGKVTDLLRGLLPTIDYRLSTIYACGPKPMLKSIAEVAIKYSMPAQVSLEEHMACGIGACLGCVTKTKSGYQRICVEGPVFEVNQVLW
ncbi:dihydroorotate dehydrogenase electron transfer subunit [bacterium]|nr:MAG: dihydroorotate dehydrogenase electron transfer subunit [bacterium]